MHRLSSYLLLSALILLTGCASTLRSEVTSFQRWPADAAPVNAAAQATYSFKRVGKQGESLEHKSYEDLVRTELGALGLKEATTGSGRFQISLDYGVNTRTEKRREPIWDHGYTYWHPPSYHPTFGWRPGYYAPDPWGPRVVGYQTVSRDVSTHRLRLDIAEGANKVFEASALLNDSTRSMPRAMPWLIKSVFDQFPGGNGQVRVIEFDTDKGVVKERRKL
jgi:hypothetical protein